MRRKLFNFAAVVSLILLLATAVAWPWSYVSRAAVGWGGASTRDGGGDGERARRVQLILEQGRFGVLYVASLDPEPVAGRPWYRSDRHRAALYDAWAPYSSDWRQGGGRFPALTGFTLGRHSDNAAPPTYWSHWVIMPFWPVALACAPLPVVRLGRVRSARRARRREAKGLCPACGYDLRASPSGCPECGMTAPAVA